MKGFFIRLREDQYIALKESPASIASQIRIAIDDFLARKEPQVSASLSKGGDKNVWS